MTSRVAVRIAGVLAVSACMLLALAGAVWPAGLWLVVIGLVALATRTLRRAPRTLQIILSAAIVPTLVILTWEGGLFFVPAAIALAVGAVCEPAPRQPPPPVLPRVHS